MINKVKYIKIRKETINGKSRCIYMKPKDAREYVRYNKEYLLLNRYLKLSSKNLIKKIKKGGELLVYKAPCNSIDKVTNIDKNRQINLYTIEDKNAELYILKKQNINQYLNYTTFRYEENGIFKNKVLYHLADLSDEDKNYIDFYLKNKNISNFDIIIKNFDEVGKYYIKQGEEFIQFFNFKIATLDEPYNLEQKNLPENEDNYLYTSYYLFKFPNNITSKNISLYKVIKRCNLFNKDKTFNGYSVKTDKANIHDVFNFIGTFTSSKLLKNTEINKKYIDNEHYKLLLYYPSLNIVQEICIPDDFKIHNLIRTGVVKLEPKITIYNTSNNQKENSPKMVVHKGIDGIKIMYVTPNYDGINPQTYYLNSQKDRSGYPILSNTTDVHSTYTTTEGDKPLIDNTIRKSALESNFHTKYKKPKPLYSLSLTKVLDSLKYKLHNNKKNSELSAKIEEKLMNIS